MSGTQQMGIYRQPPVKEVRMEVIILGSGTAVPSARRGSPGLLLLEDSLTILFDSGPGSLRRVAEAGCEVQSIDLICYTHLHIDHTADLAPYLFCLRNTELERDKGLMLVGPKGFSVYMEELGHLYGDWISPSNYDIELGEVRGKGAFKIDSCTIETHEVLHTHGSIGYRVTSEQGKVFAYSGDSGYCDGLVTLGKNADLFVLECSCPDDNPIQGHLTPSQAGKIAREAGCSKLILTHFYPACDEADLLGPCRKEFDGTIIMAEDLMRLEV